LDWCLGALGISAEQFLALGRTPESGPDFNMTVLAIHGARHINGVSRIHGQVSAEICAACWPQIDPRENPVRYVTNGVHAPTFLMPEWQAVFDQFLGAEWRNRLSSNKFWERLESIPDHIFWSVKQAIKSQTLEVLRATLYSQHLRNRTSEVHLARMLAHLDPNNPNILTIGFARRFATYKRATLLFSDKERLRRLLTDADRPLVFIFAGKAHPADKPGQQLLKAVHDMGKEPEFAGKILLVEGYDIGLARRLVAGVDVWLNNPVYPLEASGTSGMKAAFNGTINLSVLDGWWAEGYNGRNGWAVKPPHSQDAETRDREDARAIYDILEQEVVPLYYARGQFGFSPGWVKKAKQSLSSILPRYNMERMLNEYLGGFYLPAARQGKRLAADNYANARLLAEWKQRARNAWPGVRLRLAEGTPGVKRYGESMLMKVAVYLNGLEPGDLTMELLLTRKFENPDVVIAGNCNPQDLSLSCEDLTPVVSYRFQPLEALPGANEYLFTLAFLPEWCGCLRYRIRAFPYHKLLTDPHEMGLMTWL
jgi:starch phosphorylase